MKNKFIYGLILFIVLLLFFNFYTFYSGPQCTFVKSIDSSVRVMEGPRRIIGLNADTDSLKFGVASPQAVIRRSVYVTNEDDAKVTIFMEGDFASWVNITPQEFDLKAGEDQEVKFAVRIPDYPQDGNYSGKAIFCFKE